METTPKKIVLTGDRPTGPLHLGHYVGSLEKRLELQKDCDQYVLIADVQALTDHYDDPKGIRRNIEEVMLDYLAVGLTPDKTTFVLQSQVPEIAELSVYFLNLVTLARLQRNPTLKEELQQKGYEANVPLGFLTHPIHQAADIAIFDADLVPVGNDQLPLIEQTREIIRSFNRIYGQTLNEPTALLSKTPRLIGTDGRSKMSKTLGNTINLRSTSKEVEQQVNKMFTDPTRIRVTDPGHIEGNVVFAYLDVFDTDKSELENLKERYRKGGVGDVEVKRRLIGILENLLVPIRERRDQFAHGRDATMDILRSGTTRARVKTMQTMERVRKALHVYL